MSNLLLINFFHLYQPPRWRPAVVRLVARQSYRPFFRYLKTHPEIRLTLNLTGALTEQLDRLGEREIIANIRLLLQRGQIELTGSAMYHPILPLIPVAEAKRQIQLNTQANQKVLGDIYQPTGFYFPEMAYSQAVAKLVSRLGFTWTILDEITAGPLGRVDLNQPYQVKDTSLTALFRNRWLSDLFFMTDLKNAQAFWQRRDQDPRTHHLLTTACDGENLGHHNPTLLRTWHQLVNNPEVKTSTVSAWLKHHPATKSIQLRSSSWAARETELDSKQPFYLWNNKSNPIQQYQWQLTNILLAATKSSKLSNTRRQRLDELLASDQYWWASASPWWDTRIVNHAVKTSARFAASLFNAGNLTRAQYLNSQSLSKKIINTVCAWQLSGQARKRHQEYLAAEPFARYFGGQKVN
jgi:alpha-amylase/alpha-mannosidase (GH57 family)